MRGGDWLCTRRPASCPMGTNDGIVGDRPILRPIDCASAGAVPRRRSVPRASRRLAASRSAGVVHRVFRTTNSPITIDTRGDSVGPRKAAIQLLADARCFRGLRLQGVDPLREHGSGSHPCHTTRITRDRGYSGRGAVGRKCPSSRQASPMRFALVESRSSSTLSSTSQSLVNQAACSGSIAGANPLSGRVMFSAAIFKTRATQAVAGP